MDTLSAAVSTDATAPAKSHFVILDGLRGVAAVTVVIFHLFEAYAGGDPHRQIVNHGYLAVDFFFLLSGFVIAYAYDDRWRGMTVRRFLLRRVVRLQPMVVAGSVIGAALVPFQHFSIYPKLDGTSAATVILVMLVGCTLAPLPKSADIRGWDETYPLNGAAWSLFYEYLANLVYALGLRRMGVRWLAVLLVPSAIAVLHLAIAGPRGDLIGGWSLDAAGIRIGLTRVAFPFIAGILLMRLGLRVRTPHPFGIAGGLLLLALALPRLGGPALDWLNGCYDAVCVILLFPLIVAIGAGTKRVDGMSVRVARAFGDLSYPLYVTHYPLIYVYTGWVADGRVAPGHGAVAGGAVFVLAIAVAWLCLRFYDEPVRRRLARALLRASDPPTPTEMPS